MMPAPQGIAPPISSDPPFHHDARRLLLPAFSPTAVAELEPFTRAYCESLLDGLEGETVIDAATDYGQHIPVRVIAEMLGFPTEDADQFRSFIHNTLESVDVPREQRIENFAALDAYLTAQIEDHIEHPRDDLTSYLLSAEMDGEPLNPEHVGGAIALLLIAGIDTTWSSIGSTMWHLAAHPDDRRRLVAEPDLMPTAIEEFLRAYAPVTMARRIVEDTEYNGCPIKAGERILMNFPAANRDPEVFPDADKVILDRQQNRHLAFGSGIHRCAGSNLARMELRVAVEEWLARIPEFELIDPATVTWAGGQVRGPRSILVRVS